MAGRKAFLLRVDPALLGSLEKWAADDLRSLNAQIEFLLRQVVAKAGRLPTPPSLKPPNDPSAPAGGAGVKPS